MPVARSLPDTPVQAADPEPDNTAAPADGDQDADDTASYCLCGRGSFGEMIACDGVGCTVEWVSLQVSSCVLYAYKCSSITSNVLDLARCQPANGFVKIVVRRQFPNVVGGEESDELVEEEPLHVTPIHESLLRKYFA